MTSNAFSSRSARLRRISSQRTSPARTASVKAATSARVLGTTVTKNPCSPSIVRRFFLCAQLAVGDVDEARMLQQGAQAVPGLQMDAIVRLIAVVGLEVHGHRTVGRDADAVNELLEIGAALLAVPPLQLDALCVLSIVGPADHDAGSVVVDLLHLQIKILHDRQHDARLQGGAVRDKQPIESACELVVVDLAPRNETHIEQPDPFLNRIECVAVD